MCTLWMRRFLPGVLAVLVVTGCSLQQKKYRVTPSEPTRTIVVRQNQALNWSVVSSYYASNEVVLSYPLCPRQHLIGKPAVKVGAQSVAITLWANTKTCANPATQSITVQLPGLLGHRALTNPGLY